MFEIFDGDFKWYERLNHEGTAEALKYIAERIQILEKEVGLDVKPYCRKKEKLAKLVRVVLQDKKGFEKKLHRREYIDIILNLPIMEEGEMKCMNFEFICLLDKDTGLWREV